MKQPQIKPVKNSYGLKKFLVKTENELSDFFGIKIERPDIFFLNSREEIDEIWSRKTESWLSAWAAEGNIYILNPKVYAKESDHDIGHFWQTIKHEYCHLYFQALAGINYPKWLNEGLANYLSGQVKKTPAKSEAMKIFEYFQKSDKYIYRVGYFWVHLLLEQFGKEKFLELLKTLKPRTTIKAFNDNFYKIYRVKFNKKDVGALFQSKL